MINEKAVREKLSHRLVYEGGSIFGKNVPLLEMCQMYQSVSNNETEIGLKVDLFLENAPNDIDIHEVHISLYENFGCQIELSPRAFQCFVHCLNDALKELYEIMPGLKEFEE